MGGDSRAYGRTLLAAAAAGWLAFLAANYAVDPYDVLGSGVLARPAEPQERYLKTRFLRAHPGFDSFLIGNSRVGTIVPADVDRLFPDGHAYNFTMSQANAWDADAIAAWIIRTRGRVRRLFVQADFPETAGPDKPGFALLTAAPPEITGESDLAFRLRYLVTFSARPFVRKLGANLAGGDAVTYRIDTGSWSRPQLDRAIDADCAAHALRARMPRAGAPAPSPSPAVRARIDHDLGDMARLLARALEAGIETLVFVPPRHHAALDALDADDYTYFLAGLARITPYENFGFYSPITTDDCNYYETSHYRPSVGARIVSRLAAPAGESPVARHVRQGAGASEVAFVRANFAAFRAVEARRAPGPRSATLPLWEPALYIGPATSPGAPMERALPMPLHDRPNAPGTGAATRRARLAESVRWFLRRRGWDLHRFSAATSREAQLAQAVRHLGIRSVIDVGAGTGRFAAALRRLGYEGEVVSFEPYSRSHAQLEAAARRETRWHVMPAVALGAAERRAATLRIASNGDSSSLLEMLDTHREAAPHVRVSGSEAVDVTTLDLALERHRHLAPAPCLLKVDCQGSELEVLRGARASLARVAAIHIELTLVPVYAQAPLAREVLADPLLAGFELWAAWPSFVRASDGRTLQADALLVRPDAPMPASTGGPAP